MTSPLSAKELDELRDVASYEAKGVRVRAPVLSMRRLLATIEARERRIALLEARTLSLQIDKGTAERENAALEVKLANIRKLCAVSPEEISAAMEDDERASGFSDPHTLGVRRASFAAGVVWLRRRAMSIDAKPGVEET
jgi:hypothetical protein